MPAINRSAWGLLISLRACSVAATQPRSALEYSQRIFVTFVQHMRFVHCDHFLQRTREDNIHEEDRRADADGFDTGRRGVLELAEWKPRRAVRLGEAGARKSGCPEMGVLRARRCR